MIGTDIGTQVIQRVDQVLNRSLAHPRHAVQPIGARPQGDQGGKESDRRAAVADKQIGLRLRQPTGTAGDLQPRVAARSSGQVDPQPPQAVDHHPRVIAVQDTRQHGSPCASAAQTSARFVMLLEPGGRIVPMTCEAGQISIDCGHPTTLTETQGSLTTIQVRGPRGLARQDASSGQPSWRERFSTVTYRCARTTHRPTRRASPESTSPKSLVPTTLPLSVKSTTWARPASLMQYR